MDKLDVMSTVLIIMVGVYMVYKFFGLLGRWGIKQISPRDLDQKKGMVLLDVRSDKEYAKGHIPGAVHVPFSDIGDRVKKLKKDKELVVYDQMGTRSIWAIKRLIGMGYKNLTNLKGGYHAWKKIH
ncbi:MAG TPA: rhodanese-like domain-containing protein [Nitrospirota bacterium]|nr:rhodanese-like domain-containing protein [Nitrospirota bacterium]